jgi:cytochrome c peroxidase
MFQRFSICLLSLVATLQAQPSLRTVPVPQPTGVNQYIRDRQALTILGKALFWDMQLGSDGRTSCATCHFHAGADHRSQHQLTNSFNATLTSADFPFHALSDPTNNNSTLQRSNGNIYGSAGVYPRKFTAINFGNGTDDGYDLATTSADGLNFRQVTTRNSPSVINAVFNARNFWDGRARNTFTGLTPFGASDTRANVLAWRNNQLVEEHVSATNASLASQAVGPPTNSVEMSYDGLTWPTLGQRILAQRPLSQQRVSTDDSVLGSLANAEGRGLRPGLSYGDLVQQAFAPEYWQASETRNGFSQAEMNFALFFGLALQQYQSTLVSDDSPFDRFAAGDTGAMTPQQIAGLNLFRGRAECNTCHSGSEFTAASVAGLLNQGPGRGGPPNTGPDTGFFRTGVSPIEADLGLGGKDDFGLFLARNPNAPNVQGAFKTPGLRNVEFTGPYFHNGGQATLEQVVEFYNRGSDFPAGGLGPDIRRLNLNANERAALVAFMKALTDDRVKFQRAPFDHPELCIPNGHKATAQTSDSRYLFSADENWAAIPATGRSGVDVPLQTFAELLDGIGNDGTRAHTLTEACPIN